MHPYHKAQNTWIFNVWTYLNGHWNDCAMFCNMCMHLFLPFSHTFRRYLQTIPSWNGSCLVLSNAQPLIQWMLSMAIGVGCSHCVCIPQWFYLFLGGDLPFGGRQLLAMPQCQPFSRAGSGGFAEFYIHCHGCSPFYIVRRVVFIGFDIATIVCFLCAPSEEV
jgi:hypothetical protein